MRVLVVVLLAACATGESPTLERPDIVRVLYLNDCVPSGCTIHPGDDDSRTDHSSIVTAPTFVTPLVQSNYVWSAFVSCVQRMYSPFDLTITTTDPGDAPHFELIVAGSPQDLGLDNAGGAAPAICPGQVRDNLIAFVFGNLGVDSDDLCWFAAQESGHLFGLDHELNGYDPMTWLTTPRIKPAFQPTDSECGETFEARRACSCERATQNSYETLQLILGPAQAL